MRDLEHLRRRYADHVPGLLGARHSYAVLCLLVERPDGLHLLFEVRSAALHRQPGEVCFPGGRMEAGDGQFLLRLPEGAVCRGLSRFHLPAGKAGLAALADPGRPDLKQQVQSIRTLYQRTQNSIFVPGFQQRGNMIAVKPAQICQFFSHSSIVKARWQLVMSTVGWLGSYSPSRDQGRSSSVST